MTANQIAYQNHLETQRANRVREAETERSNRVREAETERSNRADEANVEARITAQNFKDYTSGAKNITGAAADVSREARGWVTSFIPNIGGRQMSWNF